MRIYVITYKFHFPQGSCEVRTEYYGKQNRNDFIERYLYLTNIDRVLYVDDVQCFTAVPEEIKDMKQVMEAK